METKKDIRKKIFQRRKEADLNQLQEASEKITEYLRSLEEYKNCRHLLTYMDFNREVMTRSMIRMAWKDGKIVSVPKCEGKDLVFYRIDSFDQLTEGYYNIMEPDPGQCEKSDCQEALMIMPGVAFDRDRHRVGYGGGFYDRYLEKHTAHHTIAVAYDFQILDKVPYDQLDIKPQHIITESGIIGDER